RARLEAVLVPLGVNLLAMLSVTLGSFYQKRFVSGGDLRTTTVWQYAGAALATAPLVFAFGAVEADWNQTLVLTMAWSVLG
uniref:hypothetical protein n=1 Tax=Proteus vulgaris TaxID=585 RepID=UPI0019540A6E